MFIIIKLVKLYIYLMFYYICSYKYNICIQLIKSFYYVNIYSFIY